MTRKPQEKFHGRRRGKTLSPRKKRLLEDVLPKVEITIASDGGDLINPASFFDFEPKEIWFEVGFGKGEHLAWQAEKHPGVGFIGCEPFLNGIAGLVTLIQECDLKNIRIFPDDARLLLDRLEAASLSRLFLLHPDPWPKKRHARRRFVNPENLDRLARTLKPGALFRVSTDHNTYKAWTMQQMQNRPDFSWTAQSASDWQTPPEDWPGTRYEAKALKEDIRCAYFDFIRAA